MRLLQQLSLLLLHHIDINLILFQISLNFVVWFVIKMNTVNLLLPTAAIYETFSVLHFTRPACKSTHMSTHPAWLFSPSGLSEVQSSRGFPVCVPELRGDAEELKNTPYFDPAAAPHRLLAPSPALPHLTREPHNNLTQCGSHLLLCRAWRLHSVCHPAVQLRWLIMIFDPSLLIFPLRILSGSLSWLSCPLTHTGFRSRTLSHDKTLHSEQVLYSSLPEASCDSFGDRRLYDLYSRDCFPLHEVSLIII